MEQWMVLLFISGFWVLCIYLLTSILSLFTIIAVVIFRICCLKSKAKGPCLPGGGPPGCGDKAYTATKFGFERQRTSAVESCQKSTKNNTKGVFAHLEDAEGSTESLKDEHGKPHGGGRGESECGRQEASARELPCETEDMAQGRNVTANTSSELLGNQPSIDKDKMEELTRLLMEFLSITQLCRELLEKLKEAPDSATPVLCRTVRKEYFICMQCGGCFTGSCPHCSEPGAEEDLPTLATILYAVDILVHEDILQLEVVLGFELSFGGEVVCMWERTHRFPEIAPERCCKDCKAPLPRSPGDSERLQAWTQHSNSSSAYLQPAGQRGSLPTGVLTWPPPPWAQPFSPAALDRLLRAGMEPLPQVEFRGVGKGLSLQRIRQSWSKAKASVWSSIIEECDWLWIVDSPPPSSTRKGDQTLPFHLQCEEDAQSHATLMAV